MAADVFTNVLKAFTARLGALESRAATVLYGRVETVNPLSVRQSDGSLLLDVETLEPDLDVGDPVRMLAHNGFRVGSRVVVVGRVGVPVLGRRIPANANLNAYTTPGQFYCPLSADVATFTNGPPGDLAGSLEVREAAGVIQYWHEFGAGLSDSNVYRRRYYAGAWTAWSLYAGPAKQRSWSAEISFGQRTGGTFYNGTVTFPVGLFTAVPNVQATVSNQASGSNKLQVLTNNKTTTGCTLGFFTVDGSDLSGHWCTADVFVHQNT